MCIASLVIANSNSVVYQMSISSLIPGLHFLLHFDIIHRFSKNVPTYFLLRVFNMNRF